MTARQNPERAPGNYFDAVYLRGLLQRMMQQWMSNPLRRQ